MERELEFFFDVGSPYSYLAATQLDDLRRRTGAAIRWRPFLLGGVFKATGNEMPARVPAKARWMLGDLHRWAAHYGVPFKMSTRFPINSLLPQRVLVAATLADEAAVEPLAMALYSAYWVEDRDVSDPVVIGEVAAGADLDGAALLQAAGAQPTKDALRAATEEAVERGAFGAPTLFVGQEMFWGNDRLHLVEELLGG